LLLLVALAALLPRTLELGRFTVVDEVDWLQASANFYNALQTGEYQHTYQLEHPAVTTMWAGALGFMRQFSGERQYKSGYVASVNQLHTDLLKAGTSPLAVLVSGRLFVVLGITAGLLLAYLLMQPLVGRWPALVAALLLAFDPFYTGLSRLLHMDALLATFFLLYALSLANYFSGQKKTVYLVLAGVNAGLAALTKSPAVFLAPYTLLALALAWWQSRTESEEQLPLSRLAKALALAVLVALIVFVGCWPAMWVAPLQTLNKIIQGALFYAEQGHISLLFFDGRVGNGADFPLSFYPLTFLWRTTPGVTLGLAAALVAVWRRWGVFADRRTRQLALNLLLLSLGFMAFMHLGAKKFDRYMLPAQEEHTS
jgi:4-amino-4-deoxy-L-arabinose transferase-like glycosyltransferase